MEASGTPSTPPTTDDLLREILAEQQQHRADVADLRSQINSTKPPVPAPANAATPEEQLAARMDEIAQHSHYCPGCGQLYDYQQQCTGKGESPHPATEVVSTDELKSGDPANHTPAPAVVT